MTSRIDYFISSVNSGLQMICPVCTNKALMLAGRNGPYQDLESPIRNTSHWLASFSIASILTGEQVYRVAANKLLQFLLDASEWQHNGLYVHRQKARKDWCNGVIGQAWVAEALLFAGKALNSEAAIDDALRLLHNLPFDAEKGAWERLDPVHRNLGIDYTYNHQSWFASVVAEAGKYDNELYLQAVSFLNLSKSASLSVDEVGVVRHLMQNQPSRLSSLSLKALIRRACSKIDPSPGHEVDPVERGIGYHLFVMYSLARLRRCIPDHSLWNTELIQKSLDLCSQRAFLDSLESNQYSYPYNAPGFELPLVAHVFEDKAPQLKSRAHEVFDEQVRKTWVEDIALFSRNTCDPVTLSARVYELGIALLYTEDKSVT